MPVEFHSELARDLTLTAIERAINAESHNLEHTGGDTELALAIVEALGLEALGFKEGVYFVTASVPPG